MRLYRWFLRVVLAAVLIPLSCGQSSSQQVVISIDPSTTYQTMSGWEATDYAGETDSPAFPNYRDQLLDLAVNDLGIDRIRLEVKSGAENSEDYWTQYRQGIIDYETWRQLRYSTVNDNGDPSDINWSGFHFSWLDDTVENVVLPMRLLAEARGEHLYVNLCYVAFTWQIGPGLDYHHDDPAEYAEFILATFLHLQGQYGWVPDALEVILEPDTVSEWDGTLIGQAIVAAAARLNANGFQPVFIAPSTTDMGQAITHLDAMMQIPGVEPYLKELSYHRYRGVSLSNLQTIASRAAQYGIDTSMLEWWDLANGYQTLHQDLEIGQNSAWQQGTLLGIYTVDDTDPDHPIVQIADMTKFTRQYFKFVRSGALRVEATSNDGAVDPLAFVNTDGRYVLVIKAAAGRSFTVQGLPEGTYGIKYTTVDEYDVDLPDVMVGAGQDLNASIPATGVITVYAKESVAPTPPASVSISGPTQGLAGVNYTFIATVQPITTTPPITYVWQATGQSPQTYVGGPSSTVAFSWDVTGSQTITGTAANTAGLAIDSHTIAIAAEPGPSSPASVAIAGPAYGLAGVDHAFTATVSPTTTTLPITYVWQATGQSPQTFVGGPSSTVTFAWEVTGTQTITATATNVGGMVSDTHSITIEQEAGPNPPGVVTIGGPTMGFAGIGSPFTSRVTPPTSTVPITHVWQAASQPTVTNTNGLTDTVTFTWYVTGTQRITVTATNAVGTVTASHLVSIKHGHPIYLPLIVRSAAGASGQVSHFFSRLCH